MSSRRYGHLRASDVLLLIREFAVEAYLRVSASQAATTRQSAAGQGVGSARSRADHWHPLGYFASGFQGHGFVHMHEVSAGIVARAMRVLRQVRFAFVAHLVCGPAILLRPFVVLLRLCRFFDPSCRFSSGWSRFVGTARIGQWTRWLGGSQMRTTNARAISTGRSALFAAAIAGAPLPGGRLGKPGRPGRHSPVERPFTTRPGVIGDGSVTS